MPNTLISVTSLPASGLKQKTRVVPVKPPHRLNWGDESVKYDKTLKLGKTIIHIVNPPQMTPEEIEQVLKDYHAAGWAIIDELAENEDQLVNKEEFLEV